MRFWGEIDLGQGTHPPVIPSEARNLALIPSFIRPWPGRARFLASLGMTRIVDSFTRSKGKIRPQPSYLGVRHAHDGHAVGFRDDFNVAENIGAFLLKDAAHLDGQ